MTKSPRTCIICGGPAGSGEHVFPAALGGRRINRGIYCGPHNEGFSPLAGTLATQLRGINALLGVINDHTKASPSVRATDLATGRSLSLGRDAVEFAEPQVISQQKTETGFDIRMAFSSEKQLARWLAEQTANGVQIEHQERKPPQRHFARESRISMQLGGPDGLRAVGYVALTFLAHRFPDLARRPELADFKAYIQAPLDEVADRPFVWWEDPTTTPENPFQFGHRVLVATDAARQAAYARVSLFSTLSFSVWFGSIPVQSSKTLVVDIDPLAPAAPRDVRETWCAEALDPVRLPTDPVAFLREDIESGRGEQKLGELLQRVSEHQLDEAAGRLLEKVAGASLLDAPDREDLFASAVDAEAQRILNLARHVVGGLAQACSHLPGVPDAFRALVEVAPDSPNGLTPQATNFLHLSQMVIANQLNADHEGGLLDRQRVAMLIGGGVGAVIIGVAARDVMLGAVAQGQAARQRKEDSDDAR